MRFIPVEISSLLIPLDARILYDEPHSSFADTQSGFISLLLACPITITPVPRTRYSVNMVIMN